MGSSVRKKKEKKKDFQKAKLKVGKAKEKPASFTDTSFKSRAIVVAQSSLTVEGPNPVEQFKHYLSLASTSRSENQRRDALAFLTTQLSHQPPNNPVGTPAILAKLLPLISDANSGVRTQLRKLLQALPPADIQPQVERISMYVRAGMTHLSADIRDDTLSIMEWLLEVAGIEVVSCAGGWMKTMNVFAAMLGWSSIVAANAAAAGGPAARSKGWTSAPKSTFGAAKGGASYSRQLLALAKFLQIGFHPEATGSGGQRTLWNSLYRLPRTSNPFGYLNLFGAPRDEDSEIYADREDRQRVFSRKWHAVVIKGLEEAKKEGGAVGRAGAVLDQTLKDGLADYDDHVS
ncbi:hypothetical protein PgNI_10636 [Pyricularia grisea]|uniref:Pre-rRNA-processing protein n=1 Tax=Pyricularia grisea TaxID=148305 RepID=A0A6P8AXU1_PYRGI|nr:hypothetical protein PgNI_10636 [Pyricularia grisea]TLD07157.1 hypothetical protein PgNI_10636 [Pyricularia grisea]